jgi:diaminopimelate epimerase
LKIQFQKYQATGNDFVLIDNRSGAVQLTLDQIRHICNRRLGVGADGLMLIESHPSEDFRLQYFNSDGSQSLCGNGSRAAVHMAASLGIVKDTARFEAFDGVHEASLTGDNTVRLKMADVGRIERIGGDFFIDTGSPHYVKLVSGG